jgi:16S rRNA (guanine527-N7)-methyltransferase
VRLERFIMATAFSTRGALPNRQQETSPRQAVDFSDPNNRQCLAEGLDQLGVDLQASTQEALLRYLSLLARWNRVYNLSAIREPGQMLTHHLLDSLAVLPLLKASVKADRDHAPSLIDVGAGAGLPGLPLALAWPSLRVVLAEPVGKKAAFLRQCVAELGLSHRVKVHGDRIEALATPVPPADQIICRAFASLADFIRAIDHLVTPRTQVWAMKGRRPTEELDRLPASWRLADLHTIEVPRLGAQRHLLRLEPATDHPGESSP